MPQSRKQTAGRERTSSGQDRRGSQSLHRLQEGRTRNSKGSQEGGGTIGETVTTISLFFITLEKQQMSVETVELENFHQESLQDDSMSLIKLFTPSSVGGAMLVLPFEGTSSL